MSEKVLFSRRGAAEAMSVSVRQVDYLIANGALRAVKLGRRTLIPRAELERLAKNGCATRVEVAR